MQRRESHWTVADAKARLSEVMERAVNDGPQVITRHGRDTVVVVSSAEWGRRKKREGNLAEFLARSPLRGSGLRIEARRDKPRPIKL